VITLAPVIITKTPINKDSLSGLGAFDSFIFNNLLFLNLFLDYQFTYNYLQNHVKT
jgi:hypothetical protein